MSPQAVFVYDPRNCGSTAPTTFDYQLAAFERAGAILIEERKFAQVGGGAMVPHGDRLVNFYCENPGAVWARCMPQFRWNYALDEVSTPEGFAYGTRLKQCRDHDVSRIVVTYLNKKHLSNLVDAKLSYVGMPFCPPRRRARTEKPNAIAAFGTFIPSTYAERARVKEFLKASLGIQRVHDALVPPKSGEAFFDALDGYQMGIVCRVGYRDRLVAKYVEYGASHVLPIGDCPSYMPADMKQAMVQTEGKDQSWIVDEVTRLLQAPQELANRQEAYCEAVHKHFNALEHADRVVKTILSV